jgi:copper resistance protein C
MAHERKLVALLFMVFLLVPDHGWGHAYLVKSSPALQEVLIRPPTEVQLWFNERLEPAYSHVSVLDAEGHCVDLADEHLDRNDSKKLVIGVRPLAPGSYKVKYRVLSVDGHIVENQFTFTVRGQR